MDDEDLIFDLDIEENTPLLEFIGDNG